MPDTCLGPVCGWIHFLSLWVKIHILPFAPLITVVVAAAAAGVAARIAWHSIQVTRSVARKRAAIDFFLKTDMDAGMVTAYKDFQDALAVWEKHVKDGKDIEEFMRDKQGVVTKASRDINSYLNVHELVAVGIKNEVFDPEVCYNFWSNALVRHTEKTKQLIDYEVASEGGAAAWLEPRTLSEKWKARIEKWQAEQVAIAKKQGQHPKPAPLAPVTGQTIGRPSQETMFGHQQPPTKLAVPPLAEAGPKKAPMDCTKPLMRTSTRSTPG